MTVVAWDGKSMAADRRAERMNLFSERKKLFEANGVVYGYSGDLASCLEAEKFFVYGLAPEDLRIDYHKGFSFLLYRRKAQTLHSAFNSLVLVEEPVDRFTAIGIGDEFAMGVMAAGFCAETAVSLCNKHIVGCGNGVDVIQCR